MDNTIIMISAGMKMPKKDFNSLNRMNLYLNYGLLGLATNLSDKGYLVKVFQGDYKSIDEIYNEIQMSNVDLKNIKYPLFVSIPSFFALSWSKEFIDHFKTINSNGKVIVGGRWVVDNNIEWLKNKMPNVNLFVKGYGEHYIEKSLDEKNWDSLNYLEFEKNDIKVFEKIDFTLLSNYRDYQPCIEVSRGCGRGCRFCVENKTKLIPCKDPKDIIREAINISKIYNDDKLNFYFQASIFNPTKEWAYEFTNVYQENNMKFSWRFETRVDTLNKDVLKILSKAGLKVIDLGLESASPNQLLNMRKTRNVKEYLEKAEIIIKEAYRNKIWIKLNILLYPGEQIYTINETFKWLKRNKKYIKGISVNPFIFYRNGDFTRDFITEIELLTKLKIDDSGIHENGYAFISLSEEINSTLAKELSMSISRNFLSLKDYYDLKSICYYKRDFTFKYFKKAIMEGNYLSEELPFTLNRRNIFC